MTTARMFNKRKQMQNYGGDSLNTPREKLGRQTHLGNPNFYY